MARPLKEISAREVELLAGCGATVEEIAAKLDCSPDTLSRRFAEEIERGRQSGRMSLRGKQFELAMKGNVAMCIWLGKQLLGQTDKYDFTHTSDEDLLAEANRYFAPDAKTESGAGRIKAARDIREGSELKVST
jgi:hypothetical protein